MVWTGIMTTAESVAIKSGANASEDFTEAMALIACLQGESMVNVIARYNFSDNYATLNSDIKYLLDDIVSSFIAIQAICYDMSGFTSRVEAEDMINVLRDGMLRGLAILKDKKAQDFINGA